jgi:hypothetical protein
MTVYTQKQIEGRYPRNWDDHSGLRRTYPATCQGRYRTGYPGYEASGFVSAPRVDGLLKKRTSSYSSSSGMPVSNSSTTAPLSPTKHTDSPPMAPNQTIGILPTPPTPAGVFVNDCPPSPRLTKSLLAHAHSRKRAGRHSLVSIKDDSTGITSRRILRINDSTQINGTVGKFDLSSYDRNCISAPAAITSYPQDERLIVEEIDRQAIPNDLYESLLSAATVAKKNGQHKLQRRRFGLSGEVETLLVRSSTQALPIPPRSASNTYSSIFSPDPSLFNYS